MSSYPSVITEDIVISGMSGRFPESDSMDEFAKNLYNNVDMITEDSRRWPIDLFGMNNRMGKVKQLDKFDGNFFGIMLSMGESIDPHSRILLETTYEAIVDAGINPQSLRGSDTGVYIGYSTFGMPDCMPEDVQPDSKTNMMDTLLWLPGTAKCLYANRISFVFDFKGPSLVIDTACSSSLVALNIAMNDMRLGKCRQAIVGGTELCVQPFTNHIFQSTRLNSSEGIPKVWDEKADGFVRAETIACLLLQRKSNSKRIYATVLNSGVNIDGNKRMGMFFPSSESQEELMIKTYKEANVDPLQVNYFEAHATGTKVGDPPEAKAIYNAYCLKPNRKDKLLIGLVKSNVGHAEGASGVVSVAKVLISYENECIPANLHLKNIKSTIKELCPPLHPINENFAYTPGIAGINNFGVGGVNAHVLLAPNYKTKNENNVKIDETIPRIINICGRTEEALNDYFKFIENNPNKITPDFLALLADTMKVRPTLNSSGFPFRGSVIIKTSNDNQIEYKKQSSVFTSKHSRPLWFLFPGLGGQWVGMAKALMPIQIFADKVEECHEILKPFGIDLKHLLLSDDPNSMSSMTNKFCATTAIEIALFDVMKALNIKPDGIIGHSFGEIACAYADDCLTTKEALLVTYIRGSVTESDKKLPKGLMAVVGLSWNEVQSVCPPGVSVVCNNAKDTVVISGIYAETKHMIEMLTKKGVFVRQLQSSEIPYHSEYLITCAKRMTDDIKKVVTNPKLRSKNWISTSVIDSEPKEELRYASAEYFVHNLISPVYFYNKFKYLPSDAIILELGPHGLFSKVVNETLEGGSYLSLIKKDSNDTNLDMFLGSIAKLYELGLNPDIEKLYPKVEWPVLRNTPSIGSLLQWEHSEEYFVKKYPDYHFRSTASDMNHAVFLSRAIKSFLHEHVIDGNVLYPATGYLMLAWKRMAASYGRIWNQIPVIFEDIQFRRAIFLSETEETRIKVKYLEHSGDFMILENNNIACIGKVRTTDDYCLSCQSVLIDQNNIDFEVELKDKDIYKDLKILGYDYGSNFRNLKTIKTKDFKTLYGDVEWEGNWITFMDSLFQTMALGLPFRKMMVPVMIKSLRCDPKVFHESIKEHKVSEQRDFDVSDEKIEEVMKSNANKKSEDEIEIGEILSSNSIEYIEELFSKEFHIYKSIIPIFVDMNSRMIITKGIEVEDLMALPLPRKTNVQDLKLESYQFIANEDYNAIEEYDKNKILEYIKVCTKLTENINQLIEGNNNKTNFDFKDEKLMYYLSDIKEDQILLKLLNEVYKGLTDENQNVIQCGKIITDLQNKPEFDMSLDVINQVSKNEHLIRSLLDIVSENNIPRKEIKVLEINLSNGLMAKEVDNHLASSHIYTIDVNYTIAVKAIDSIHEDFKNKSFKLIEWNPKQSQTDFPSDITQTDLILLKDSNDLWELNTETHLQELFDAIVSKGFLLTVFRYEFTKPELSLNAMNGKLENSNLENRIVEFITIAQKIGFKIIGRKTDSIGSMAILFRKFLIDSNNPKTEDIIQIDSNCEQWFEKLQQKLNENKSEDKTRDNIWLIANDSSINGILGLINCLRLEPGGEAIRCVFDCNNLIKLPINFNEKPFSDILSNDLVMNVLKNGKTGTYRHLTLPKDYDKIESNDYYLNNGHNRDISSLQWYDLNKMKNKSKGFDLDNKEVNYVKCHIYSTGLNFKDVMFATGRITSGPMSLFTDCVIGFEFAGRRSDTGVRICGFDISRCFASSVDAMDNMISPIPDHWSMDEAVTVLATYSTVWYGLIERAQLIKGEKVLIHSGAGGVGQAAINVCKYYNCDIFVTVGTEDKKKFLMETYNIPENRIFSSRDIQFKYRIKSLTDGKGVDLVLNSLTGDKLDASYECVADCGRFVEIGKYDLQMNKKLGMFSFLRDISFIGISVDRKIFLSPDFINKWWKWMHENSNNGMIKPINRTVFRAEEAEKAFRYMTTGKHIGKIVIKIRDEEMDRNGKNGFISSPILKSTVKTFFDSNKVYIITGGLGGMGLELVHWMISLGARNIVLTSRYGVKTDYQKFILKRIESLSERFKMFGTKIIISTNNTHLIEGSKQLLSEANSLGPIGGVFHLALVLNDGLLESHTFDKYIETIDSKTKAFENLDKMSRELNIDLDYFVVFSTVSCSKGNSGQSNYGYANSVCERICEQRRRDGLHGLAIQWGPIGDVGVIAEGELTSLAGIVKQRINSCLDILDKLLQSQHSIVSCICRAKRLTQSGTRESRIVNQIWQALGIDPKTTPDYLTLGEIGIESMFAVELQQGLERDYEIKLSLNDIKHITIKQMKDFESGKIEELKNFADEVKGCRLKLSKVKFIIPTENHIKLNNINTGKPVYFLPPLEGIFASLEALAENINRPVIGLNWTKDMESLTIKELNIYYTNLLKTLHPKGDYDIVGHFYGALIAMKMLKKAPIGRAVIIDILSEIRMDEDMMSDEYILELITAFIAKDLPQVMKDKIRRDCMSKPDVNSKLIKISDELKEFVGKSLVSRDLEEILVNSYKRVKLFSSYRINLKNKLSKLKVNIGKKYLQMNGKLLIIKPLQSSTSDVDLDLDTNEIEKIKNAYFLPEKGLEGKLNFESVEGKEDSKTFHRIAESINQFLSKK